MDTRCVIGNLLKEMLKERINLLIGFLGRIVAFAERESDAVFVAEQLVDSDRVVERFPAFDLVLRSAGNQERPRRHQRVQLVQVVTLFDHLLVRTGPGIGVAGNARLALEARFEAKIPRLPVIHIRALLIEHDARIGPGGTSKLIVQATRKHRPLAAV